MSSFDSQELADILYESNNDICINGVPFNSQLLKKYPVLYEEINQCWDHTNNITLEGETTIYSRETIHCMKDWMFNKPINYKLLNIGIIMEIHEITKQFELFRFYDNMTSSINDFISENYHDPKLEEVFKSCNGIEFDLNKIRFDLQIDNDTKVSEELHLKGLCYLIGVGYYIDENKQKVHIRKNCKTAFNIFNTNMTKYGNRDSQYQVALCYLNGSGVEPDYNSGLQLLENNITEANHVESLNLLYSLDNDGAIDIDDDDLVNLLIKYWEQYKNKDVLDNLVCKLYGVSNYEQAYRYALIMNNYFPEYFHSVYLLVLNYSNIKNKDENLAKTYVEKLLATKNNKMIAKMYYFGLLVKEDEKLALEYYKLSNEETGECLTFIAHILLRLKNTKKCHEYLAAYWNDKYISEEYVGGVLAEQKGIEYEHANKLLKPIKYERKMFQ